MEQEIVKPGELKKSTAINTANIAIKRVDLRIRTSSPVLHLFLMGVGLGLPLLGIGGQVIAILLEIGLLVLLKKNR